MSELIARAARLGEEGTAYALATVVGVRRPASARTGNQAIVTADGAIDGWVGGACSEPVVIREALRSLADGEPRLVKICPDGSEAAGDGPDVVVAVSSCASEGTVEVFIQPHLPSPLLRVVSDSPAGRTLVELARAIGWRVAAGPGDGDAVVVATMGRGDEDALADAIATGAEYVGLVERPARRGGADGPAGAWRRTGGSPGRRAQPRGSRSGAMHPGGDRRGDPRRARRVEPQPRRLAA